MEDEFQSDAHHPVLLINIILTYRHIKYTSDPDGTANAIQTQGGLHTVFSFL